jgi:hypothetical protein
MKIWWPWRRKKTLSLFDVHGFTLDKGRFTTHDDPNASFATTIFDVNSHDRLVGGYVDVGGHNHSFTATCSGVF